MDIVDPSFWAIWCACLLLLIAAVVNARTLLVPNQLSYSAALAGWLLAFAIGASVGIPSHGGGLMPSLAATAIGFLLLVPFYKSGWLGGGCVKMQMGFGAWVGCALGLPAAALVTGFATAIGGLVTAIAFMAALRLRAYEGADSSFYLFPAQVTLSLGSVGGVIAAGLLGWF